MPAAKSTVDQAEVDRFSALAAEWWDTRGKMAPLHKFNPVRLGYIRDRAAEHFGRDPKKLDCLKGLRILDIGCGGGILSEPLARLGASMVGGGVARTVLDSGAVCIMFAIRIRFCWSALSPGLPATAAG